MMARERTVPITPLWGEGGREGGIGDKEGKGMEGKGRERRRRESRKGREEEVDLLIFFVARAHTHTHTYCSETMREKQDRNTMGRRQ